MAKGKLLGRKSLPSAKQSILMQNQADGKLCLFLPRTHARLDDVDDVVGQFLAL